MQVIVVHTTPYSVLCTVRDSKHFLLFILLSFCSWILRLVGLRALHPIWYSDRGRELWFVLSGPGGSSNPCTLYYTIR